MRGLVQERMKLSGFGLYQATRCEVLNLLKMGVESDSSIRNTD